MKFFKVFLKSLEEILGFFILSGHREFLVVKLNGKEKVKSDKDRKRDSSYERRRENTKRNSLKYKS